MNPSSSGSTNEINIEKEFPKIIPEFEYLISLHQTQVFVIDKALKEDYKLLDTVIDAREYSNTFNPFKDYINRTSKRIFELQFKIKELEEILRTKILKVDSEFYPFYLEQYRIETGYYKQDCESLLDQ